MALSIAAALYVVRDQRRRRQRIAPLRPHIKMSEISDMPALFEIEKKCLDDPDPRAAFRHAAIESVVGALYLEAIAECGVENTSDVRETYTRIWQGLREYLR